MVIIAWKDYEGYAAYFQKMFGRKTWVAATDKLVYVDDYFDDSAADYMVHAAVNDTGSIAIPDRFVSVGTAETLYELTELRAQLAAIKDILENGANGEELAAIERVIYGGESK